MLNVLITVDTEVWPLLPDWREVGLDRDIRRDIYGETTTGACGISYQMDVLNRYGLKAVFFVEPLFAEVAGREPLRAIIEEIRDKGHEVQAHLHPEWLGWMDQPVLTNPTPQYLKDFSEEDQTTLIARGLAILRECGADPLCAFRAGDFAADVRTLRALAKNGITYDTSLNVCYVGSRCGLNIPGLHLQPELVEQVWEVPVSYYRDRPGHHRHAQLSACSWPELRNALVGAWQQGWYSFVIVSHSFELLKRRRQRPERPQRDGIVVRRFERMCEFLSENRDKFCATGFADLAPASVPSIGARQVLNSTLPRTLCRYVEQVVRRVA